MNIASLQYSLKNKTLEIYLSGCFGTCNNCQNAELKDFSIGKDYKQYFDKLCKKNKSGMVDNYWILGGDPIDQDYDNLLDLLSFLHKFNKPIWLWTRYELHDIPSNIKSLCAYIKTGEYVEYLPEYIDEKTGIKLASNNQKIFKI